MAKIDTITVQGDFDITTRRLYIPVYIQGHVFNGILDTGSQDILVTEKVINDLGLTKGANKCYQIGAVSFDGSHDYVYKNLNARENNMGFHFEEEGIDIVIGTNCMLFSVITINAYDFTFEYPIKITE